MSQAGEADFNSAIKVGGSIVAHQTNRGVLEYSGNNFMIRSYGANNGDGVISFRTAGGGNTTDAEAARFDNVGSLLIGTTTEGVVGGENLTIGDSGEGGITIRTGTSSKGNIYFSDGTSGDAEYEGIIRYDHNGDYMTFATASAHRMRIDGSGNVKIGSGTPAEKLDVGGTIQITTSSGTHPAMRFQEGSNTRAYMGAGDWAVNGLADDDFGIASSYTGDFAIATAFVNRFHITNAGTIGVGTTSPASLLHLETTRGTISGGTDHKGSVITLKTEAQWESGYGNDATASDNDFLGGIEFSTGDDSTGEGVRVAIRATVDSYYNTNSLVFETAADATAAAPVEHMRIHPNGNIKLGQNTGSRLDNCPLQIERQESTNDSCIRTKNPSTNSRYHFDFWNSSGTQGNITVNSGSVSYNSTSDYRKKENVNYNWDGTTELKKLKPAKFNFIGNSDTIQGFLAHEVSDVVPLAVTGEKDGTEKYTDEDGEEKTREVYQSMDVSKLVPLLVKTIQELEARITALEGG